MTTPHPAGWQRGGRRFLSSAAREQSPDQGVAWLVEGYGEMLSMYGDDLPIFLDNLGDMHDRVALTFPESRLRSLRGEGAPRCVSDSGLSADALGRVFRLHFVLNEAGEFVRVGPTLARICPELMGSSLLEHFSVHRPRNFALTRDRLSKKRKRQLVAMLSPRRSLKSRWCAPRRPRQRRHASSRS